LWVDLGEETAVRAWTSGVLDDDTGFLRLAKAATQITRSHADGDRVTRNRPTVHRAGLEKVVDVDQMIARLDAIAAGTAPNPTRFA
jgi:hypothetical protein